MGKVGLPAARRGRSRCVVRGWDVRPAHAWPRVTCAIRDEPATFEMLLVAPSGEGRSGGGGEARAVASNRPSAARGPRPPHTSRRSPPRGPSSPPHTHKPPRPPAATRRSSPTHIQTVASATRGPSPPPPHTHTQTAALAPNPTLSLALHARPLATSHNRACHSNYRAGSWARATLRDRGPFAREERGRSDFART